MSVHHGLQILEGVKPLQNLLCATQGTRLSGTHVIRCCCHVVIELFVELLTVRIQLIDKQKEIPGDMIEAISSLVYAAQRITDLPELQVAQTFLTGLTLFHCRLMYRGSHICQMQPG